jgi:hypothetical protein
MLGGDSAEAYRLIIAEVQVRLNLVEAHCGND